VGRLRQRPGNRRETSRVSIEPPKPGGGVTYGVPETPHRPRPRPEGFPSTPWSCGVSSLPSSFPWGPECSIRSLFGTLDRPGSSAASLRIMLRAWRRGPAEHLQESLSRDHRVPRRRRAPSPLARCAPSGPLLTGPSRRPGSPSSTVGWWSVSAPWQSPAPSLGRRWGSRSSPTSCSRPRASAGCSSPRPTSSAR
jgi:hypothetical protein